MNFAHRSIEVGMLARVDSKTDYVSSIELIFTTSPSTLSHDDVVVLKGAPRHLVHVLELALAEARYYEKILP